jgi:hypothetical protein
MFVDSSAGTVSVPLAHVIGAALGGYLATEHRFGRWPKDESDTASTSGPSKSCRRQS